MCFFYSLVAIILLMPTCCNFAFKSGKKPIFIIFVRTAHAKKNGAVLMCVRVPFKQCIAFYRIENSKME